MALEYTIQSLPLEEALLVYSEQTRVTVSHGGVRVKGLTSTKILAEKSRHRALRQLLKGTGLTFKFLTPRTVQLYPLIEQRIPDRSSSQEQETTEDDSKPLETVVVTASKRPDTVFNLSASVSVLSQVTFDDLGSFDFQSIAPFIAGVATTNLGTGRNKIFIRGLSDGAFAERTQSTVGIYLDETPVTFNDANPELRLFDVDHIELMRGPQGTLYGAGSIGGLYRIITNKPDLSEATATLRADLSTTQGGGLNYVADMSLNAPLMRDKLGVRFAGYFENISGYIDDTLRGVTNSNELRRYGIRPSVRWRANDNWLADLSLNYQSIDYDDSQYYFVGLERNERRNFLAEPYRDTFLHTNLTVQGALSKATITSASSFVERNVDEVYDATLSYRAAISENEGTAFFSAKDNYKTFSHETRLASNDQSRFNWLVGLFYFHREQDYKGDFIVDSSNPMPLGVSEKRRETVKEAALYGEATYEFETGIKLDMGIRVSRNSLTTDATANSLDQTDTLQVTDAKKSTSLTPKVAIKYEWSDDLQTYLQLSKGYRVGGININTPLAAVLAFDPDDTFPDGYTFFDADSLWSLEAGLKAHLFDRRLSMNIAAFAVRWTDVQSDQITPSGIGFVTNVGNARNLGIELDLNAHLTEGLNFRTSLFWNQPELTTANSFINTSVGDSLPAVPEFSGSFSLSYDFPVSSTHDATISADYSYVGSSALTFSEGNSVRLGRYGLANARLTVRGEGWTAGAYARNLFDSKANTFAFGNAFSFPIVDQITPPQPRTIGLFVSRTF